MKKIIVVCMALLMSLLMSCSKEDRMQNKLAGEWVICHDTYINTDPRYPYPSCIDAEKGWIINFYDNGNALLNNVVFDYIIEDDILSLGYSGTFKIEKLTSSDLKIRQQEIKKAYIQDENGENEITYMIESYIELKRLSQ